MSIVRSKALINYHSREDLRKFGASIGNTILQDEFHAGSTYDRTSDVRCSTVRTERPGNFLRINDPPERR